MGIATAASDPRPVSGRVDSAGRLIAADPRFEALQKEAGGAIGKPLALPQIAAVARLALELGTSVTRPVVAADSRHDIDLWVRATPDDHGVDLILENWTERAPSAPRLALLVGEGTADDLVDKAALGWSLDDELRIVSLSLQLATDLGVRADEAIGQPLTRFLKLEEDENGEMPLLAAAAGRRAFYGQPARPRGGGGSLLWLTGEVVLGSSGAFAGFQGTAHIDGAAPPGSSRVSFDEILDEALRNPLDRIIEQADRIVAQSDGPLQADYAAYGNDIAAAARHLLSVVRSMNAGAGQATGSIDLAE
ncbi:MAG TPA: PAS domain-containing sensor histidine kinase, partial [Sphingomicrobium sp.]